jgi:hypothetical protein
MDQYLPIKRGRSCLSPLFCFEQTAEPQRQKKRSAALRASVACVDALREAQLWMLKEGRQRGLDIEDSSIKKPMPGRLPSKYWAAFVLSGDWR